jgi:hypothetical protein
MDIVVARLPETGELTLWIARAPRLLRRVEYRTYLPGKGDVTVVWTWSGWAPDARSGYVPSGHAIDIAGVRFQEVAYTRFGADSLRRRLAPVTSHHAARDLRCAQSGRSGTPAAGRVAGWTG